jgi:hypothetical protein
MTLPTLPTLPIEQLEEVIQGALSGKLPAVAKGTVQVQIQGWNTANYYDAITGKVVTFSQPPTVVAVGLYREGAMQAATAPTISIPTVELPPSPTIIIPSITLPPIPSITIMDFTSIENSVIADLENLQGYTFTCGAAFDWLCTELNKLMALWNTAINDLITFVVNVGTAFFNAKQNLQALIASLQQLQANAQDALNAYQANIQSSINSALASAQSVIQAALNSYQAYIQSSINAGLAAVIPVLYDMIGLASGQLITPVQLRNVATDGFEFYGLSVGMQVSYVAIGTL